MGHADFAGKVTREPQCSVRITPRGESADVRIRPHNHAFRATMGNGIVLATLRELANSGVVSDYILTGKTGGYTLAVRYGKSHQTLLAKRGEPRLFAKVETAFELLRLFNVASVEVIIAGYEEKPRPYRKGRPGALKALAMLKRDSAEAKTEVKAPKPRQAIALSRTAGTKSATPRRRVQVRKP